MRLSPHVRPCTSRLTSWLDNRLRFAFGCKTFIVWHARRSVQLLIRTRAAAIAIGSYRRIVGFAGIQISKIDNAIKSHTVGVINLTIISRLIINVRSLSLLEIRASRKPKRPPFSAFTPRIIVFAVVCVDVLSGKQTSVLEESDMNCFGFILADWLQRL